MSRSLTFHHDREGMPVIALATAAAALLGVADRGDRAADYARRLARLLLDQAPLPADITANDADDLTALAAAVDVLRKENDR